MDKNLIQKFIAWLLISFGSFLTAGFLILFSEGTGEIGHFFAWLATGFFPITGGIAMIRGANKRVKRLKQEKSERDILRLASQNQGRLTVGEVASKTALSLDEARQKLEKMQESGYAHLEVSDKGAVIYAFPELLMGSSDGHERI